MTKVGIPRGLLFFRYFPLWETFFENLGMEVVLSHSATERVIAQGSKCVPSDLCLPVKIYFGHIVSLKEKVDYLFIPRYISIKLNAYMCPKLIGLPDMVLSAFGSLPPLIDFPIHCKVQGVEAEKIFFLKIGRFFSKKSNQAEEAYQKGLERQSRFRALIRKGFSFEESLDLSRSQAVKEKVKENGGMKLGIIGRPYYLHDPFLRKSIVEQVESKGYQLLTSEVLSDQEIQKGIRKLRKRIYWSFGEEMVGAAIEFSQEESIKGIIHLASFGCGQDSFNYEMVKHYTGGKVPILSFIFDEHFATGGFLTRIEAFLEMIGRRMNRR